jgi:hypothetical protein
MTESRCLETLFGNDRSVRCSGAAETLARYRPLFAVFGVLRMSFFSLRPGIALIGQLSPTITSIQLVLLVETLARSWSLLVKAIQ